MNIIFSLDNDYMFSLFNLFRKFQEVKAIRTDKYSIDDNLFVEDLKDYRHTIFIGTDHSNIYKLKNPSCKLCYINFGISDYDMLIHSDFVVCYNHKDVFQTCVNLSSYRYDYASVYLCDQWVNLQDRQYDEKFYKVYNNSYDDLINAMSNGIIPVILEDNKNSEFIINGFNGFKVHRFDEFDRIVGSSVV